MAYGDSNDDWRGVFKSEAVEVIEPGSAYPVDQREAVVARALRSSTVVISLMGPHAGESTHDILLRKIEDVKRCGQTMWAINSWKAKPDQVRQCQPEFLYIVNDPPRRRDISAGEAHRDAGSPTAGGRAACECNPGDRQQDPWGPLPEGLSEVTTNARFLKNGNGRALVLKSLIDLRASPKKIQMTDFADISGAIPVPLRTAQGSSTVCAKRQNMQTHPEAWHKERLIIAIAEFMPPYAVWLR